MVEGLESSPLTRSTQRTGGIHWMEFVCSEVAPSYAEARVFVMVMKRIKTVKINAEGTPTTLARPPARPL